MTASRQKLRVLDLFSGIGGFSLGLEWAGGFEPVAFCEMKPHARAVLAKHWPSVPCHDDMTTYDFKEGEADVITAGFPCQDISFAGAGAGLAGARSGLYREVIRAIRVVRPLSAVLENVAALLSRGLGTVLGDLASIGYDAEWHCIPASAVGAPHRRDRIWIVADAGGEQHESCRPPLSGALAAELSRAFARNAGASSRHDEEADAQHPDAYGAGPYRETEHVEGNAEFRDEQVCQPGSLGQDVADAPCKLLDRGGKGAAKTRRHEPADRRKEMADAKCVRQSRSRKSFVASHPAAISEGQASHAVHGRIRGQWSIEPRLGRVAHGVPNRVDRLEELGNAVVPQIPEIIGCAILASLNCQEAA